MNEPPIKPGTVAVHTHDGIYVVIHGAAPVFDEMLPQYFRDAMDKIEEVRSNDSEAENTDSLPCCGSESGVHLIGCGSPDAHRIHRSEEEET